MIYLYSAAIVAVLLVLAAYLWYHYGLKWTPAKYVGGQTVVFTGGPASRMRFRRAVFATQSPAGVEASWDVTAVLNGMAAAYPRNTTVTELALGGAPRAPLNPFSFVKAGFNDPKTVPTAAASLAWAKMPSVLTLERALL